jgi:hypothetical protein
VIRLLEIILLVFCVLSMTMISKVLPVLKDFNELQPIKDCVQYRFLVLLIYVRWSSSDVVTVKVHISGMQFQKIHGTKCLEFSHSQLCKKKTFTTMTMKVDYALGMVVGIWPNYI